MPRYYGLVRREKPGEWRIDFPDVLGLSLGARSLGELRGIARSALARAVAAASGSDGAPAASSYEKVASQALAGSAMLMGIEVGASDRAASKSSGTPSA
jgi:hypothetical protein